MGFKPHTRAKKNLKRLVMKTFKINSLPSLKQYLILIIIILISTEVCHCNTGEVSKVATKNFGVRKLDFSIIDTSHSS
jgi:hypothetical protein